MGRHRGCRCGDVRCGGLFAANAASPESSTVSIAPVRVLDTRTDVGLAGPFVSAVAQDLKVTGSIPTATGTQTVVPAGATGVFLNVTPVSSTAAGFISVRPANATGLPTTSNVNFTTGAINPNAVLVELPVGGGDDGKIEITFDAFGAAGPTTEVLVDVVGYTTDTRLKAIETPSPTKPPAASAVQRCLPPTSSLPASSTPMGRSRASQPNLACTRLRNRPLAAILRHRADGVRAPRQVPNPELFSLGFDRPRQHALGLRPCSADQATFAGVHVRTLHGVGTGRGLVTVTAFVHSPSALAGAEIARRRVDRFSMRDHADGSTLRAGAGRPGAASGLHRCRR